MKTPLKLLGWSIALVVVDAVLVRVMAHGHVAHSLLAGGPTLGAALLAAALVAVRFVALVIVPGLLATAAVLATAHYFAGTAGSKSTGTSSGGDSLDAPAEADVTGTSMGARGME